jgi:hypothetical protein
MKTPLSLIAFTLGVVMLLGCSTTYTIRTKDGREFQSLERPEETVDRFVKFETKSGRKVVLKEEEVSTISKD